MTEPALESIKENFPGATITVLAKKWVSPVFENHPAVDDIIFYDERLKPGLQGYFGLVSKIRELKFDLTVLFQHAFGAAMFARFARIPLRLGYNTDMRGLFLTLPIKFNKKIEEERHQTRSYLSLLESVGVSGRYSHPVFHLSDEAEAEADSRLIALGLAGEFVLGIAPGASYGSAKQWPPEKYAASGQEILDSTGGKAIIFGSEKEKDIAADIHNRLKPRSINLAGQTGLAEAAALVKKCNLFLSNDSGLMHVAAAVGVPVVSIFGPTNHISTGPATGKALIVRHDVVCAPCMRRVCNRPTHECMDKVSAQEVAAAAFQLLKDEEKNWTN